MRYQQPEFRELHEWAKAFAPAGLVQAIWVLKLFDQMKANEGGAETAIRYESMRADAAEDEVKRLQGMVEGLCERIAKQSDLLSRRAEAK